MFIWGGGGIQLKFISLSPQLDDCIQLHFNMEILIHSLAKLSGFPQLIESLLCTFSDVKGS